MYETWRSGKLLKCFSINCLAWYWYNRRDPHSIFISPPSGGMVGRRHGSLSRINMGGGRADAQIVGNVKYWQRRMCRRYKLEGYGFRSRAWFEVDYMKNNLRKSIDINNEIWFLRKFDVHNYKWLFNVCQDFFRLINSQQISNRPTAVLS